MSCNKNKAYLYPIIIGAILIIAGLLIKIPGGALTTYESLNGDSTDYYVFDDKYSAIDEYVGGDAYNYIIGATLVAGKISGAMTSKTVCFVGGLMCIAFGMTVKMIQLDVDKKSESFDELPEL